MKKSLSVGLLVLGILCLVISAVYFTHSANSLPHFFLGYLKGSTHKHTKHAVAFAVLGFILFIGAWMTSGSSSKTDTKLSDTNNEKPQNTPAS